MNRKKTKDRNLSPDNYCKQDVYIPPSGEYIATSLVIALILNFLPLQENILIFRPDFVAITIIYWSVNYPYKMGMSIAFGMGLMMDVGNTAILGQHALAYCIAVYLTLILGRRLRIFSLTQQAPQMGLILLAMQIVIVLVAIASGAHLPGWQYFSATVTGILLWVPISVLLSTPLKQKSDFNAL
ncbi:rod shape-determining protein MreD [Nitrosomonas sp. Nm166]|uniref:rod shape-determining protein MreD n=1 Tax=Nitrosomonas sp. Nm166 TaxID=1881054 RepID=UPI0008E5D014|nr:rod shape-determining protein MreD [Nitrosomonas sp. Nm166]SFE07144.1 rod shape-determining protein MreD [Nitrosomonas sp. Nm166]